MNTQKQIEILKSCYPFLSDDDVNILLEIGTYVFLEKRSPVIESGKVDQRIFFLLQGMVRGYYINPEGEEVNVFLRPEHTVTGSPDAMFNDQPTKYNFETVTPTHLIYFPFKKIISLSESHPGITKVYIEGLTENVQTLIFRVESLVDKLPEERYDDLLEKSPQFFNSALNKHIANYLGITPNSLSRIIKRKKNSRN